MFAGYFVQFYKIHSFKNIKIIGFEKSLFKICFCRQVWSFWKSRKVNKSCKSSWIFTIRDLWISMSFTTTRLVFEEFPCKSIVWVLNPHSNRPPEAVRPSWANYRYSSPLPQAQRGYRQAQGFGIRWNSRGIIVELFFCHGDIIRHPGPASRPGIHRCLPSNLGARRVPGGLHHYH